MEYVKPLKFFKQLMRYASTRKPYERLRVLGVDIGSEYVNVAVSGQYNTTAVPLWHHCAAITQTSNEDEVGLLGDKLQTLIADYNAMGLVVGYHYPYRLPYTINIDKPWAVSVMRVVDKLQKTGKLDRVKYTYWVDLIPSQDMDVLIRHHVGFICKNLNVRQDFAKEIMNRFSATHLLQGYLDCLNMIVKIDKKDNGMDPYDKVEIGKKEEDDGMDSDHKEKAN
ncbi:hypothetical protein ACOSQ4_020447 [Xanthoceras sorbifolium]